MSQLFQLLFNDFDIFFLSGDCIFRFRHNFVAVWSDFLRVVRGTSAGRIAHVVRQISGQIKKQYPLLESSAADRRTRLSKSIISPVYEQWRLRHSNDHCASRQQITKRFLSLSFSKRPRSWPSRAFEARYASSLGVCDEITVKTNAFVARRLAVGLSERKLWFLVTVYTFTVAQRFLQRFSS